MPRRGEERKAQWETFCKRGITEAVVRLLAREGSEALTMERVASEAGVAKGTVYVHFKDKRSLLQHVKETTIRPLREEISTILEGDLPPVRKLEEMVRRQLEYFDENRELLKVLLWQRKAVESHIDRQSSDPYRALVSRVAAVVQEGIDAASFKRVDPTKAAAILVEAAIATVTQRLRQERPSPVEEDVQVLLEVVLHGLSLPKATHSKRGRA